jgi:hypothetical protein
MTENKLEKRAIRQRMEETGEKYTIARRALQDAADGPSAHELQRLLRPESVTAIVSGGGGANLALAMPVLAQHLDDGGHLVVTQYRDDALALPNALDFVVTRGIATVAEVMTWLESDDEDSLKRAIEAAVPGVQVSGGPTTPALLAKAMELGPKPLLYVQDVQTDPPLRQPNPGRELSEFDLVPDNVRAIRDVIDKVGGRAIIGHCIPAEDIESWEPISKVSDYTLAIEHDYIIAGEDETDEVCATVEVFDSAGPLDSYEATLDSGFSRWRSALLP